MPENVRVSGSRCEYMVDPLGLGIEAPRLSWELRAARRGVRQTAYRIRVTNGDTVVWDTGKTASGSSSGHTYEGTKLRARRRYEWQVMVWDERGEASEWSGTAWWEMGLLGPEDWSAKWIEPEQTTVAEEPPLDFYDRTKKLPPTDYGRLLPCPLLRRRFEAKGAVRRARIYATAHGIYELELNGRRVGDQELAPEMTSYDRYLQVQTYDVTELVEEGANALGATLADGWYAGRVGLMGDNCQYGNRLALLLQLEIEYEDGSRQTVVSDDGFRSSFGPYVYSDLFIGERYDARLEKPGWSTAGYDDRDWSAVREVERDRGVLVAAYGEPVRAVLTLAAERIIRTPLGETVVDFGQVVAGRVRMRVQGEAGAEVVLEHSEVLDERGNYLNNIRGRFKDQRDVYVLRGDEAGETYEPKFTFHGFRYVRVTGYPGEPRAGDFEAVVLSSDLRVTGDFSCSDERINRLQANIVWSQRGNLLSIPTDCPQRERAGWTGDIQVFAPTACFNMDVNPFLSRWLRNMAAEQREDGQVPIVVPYLKGYENIIFPPMGTHSSAGWGDACIIVPWTLYENYGDTGVLAEHYGMMVRWLDYIERSASEGAGALGDAGHLAGSGDSRDSVAERKKYLWNTGFHFGDWLIPSMSVSKDGQTVDMMQSAFATKELVSTCFFAYSAELLSRIAKLLGKEEDASRYAELNRNVRRAFAEEYMNEDGRLKAHFQGIYVLALRMKMIPDEARGKVLNQLVGLIEDNGNRLDTGFLSVPYLLDVLCDNGRSDVAYRLLYQTECPSWLYEVEKGATTIWEAWQAIMPSGKVTNVSYNHYAFGCIGDWLYRRIAGLDKGEAGYGRIVVKPAFDCGLTWVGARYESVLGTIVSEWRLDGAAATQIVTVPPNATAVVHLPGANLSEAREGGKALRLAEGLISARQTEDGVVAEIGSGSYLFEYTR